MSNIRCYLINLASRQDRLALALGRLEPYKLDVEVFPARDGTGVEAAHGFSLKGGERGCFRSHRDLLQMIASKGDQDIHLILEDDATFAGDFPRKLKSAISELPQDWGYLQVGWLPTKWEASASYRFRNRLAGVPLVRSVVRVARPDIKAAQPTVVRERPAWGTHCYAVRPWFARKMAASLGASPFAAVDFYFRFVWDVDSFGMYKMRFPLSGQDWTVGSDVYPERFATAAVQIDDRGRLLRPPKQ